MASKVSGMIEYIKTDNGNNLAIASTAYGYCSTLADEPIKTVEMTGFYLYEGVTIHIKFENANTANNPKLKFNNETDDKAKPLISYDAQPIRPSDSQALGWMPGAVLTLTYDGESWINTSVGEHTHAALAPLLSKTYDSYIISANNKNNGVLYFGHVIIDNTNIWSLPWSVHYKLYVTTTEENTQGVYDCRFIVNGGTANYYILNNFYSTSYYPIYSHSLLFPKNGYSEQGAYLGMRVYSAYASTTLARTYKIEILETSNCTVVFNNDLIRYSEIFNNTYFTFGEYNGTTNGLQETGDANTNTINVLQRTNNHLDNGSSLYLHGYPLFGLDANNKAQAISTYSEGYTKSTTNISVKGTRIYNSNGFDWTKGLYYNGSSTVYAPNALLNFSPYTSYSNFDFRYSDNVVASDTINNLGLINKMPIYLRGTIEADSLFHLAPITVSYNNDEYERAWTQTIPSVENENGNFVYWFVGYPYYNSSYADSLYQATLYEDNKLYWYKDNQLKEYIPEAINSLKVNNHTVLSDVPANAIFTDTNKYHTSGSWNELTYTATAVNNADELKFTIPDNYGDTKNPYASKTKNYILAAPSNANGVPSFRALVAADLPIASTSALGIVKAGNGINIDSNGTISVSIQNDPNVSYVETNNGQAYALTIIDSPATNSLTFLRFDKTTGEYQGRLGDIFAKGEINTISNKFITNLGFSQRSFSSSTKQPSLYTDTFWLPETEEDKVNSDTYEILTTKTTTSIGSENNPIFFNNLGQPQACGDETATSIKKLEAISAAGKIGFYSNGTSTVGITITTKDNTTFYPIRLSSTTNSNTQIGVYKQVNIRQNLMIWPETSTSTPTIGEIGFYRSNNTVDITNGTRTWGGGTFGRISYDAPYSETSNDTTTSYNNNRFTFKQYSHSNYAANNYYDIFYLPSTNSNTENHLYSILTSKYAVTIGQGGTGAITAENARANLGTWSLINDTYNTLMPADGITNGWIKIGTANTSYGILPSQTGGIGSGHNYLGATTWYWSQSFIDNMYTNRITFNGSSCKISYTGTKNTYTMIQFIDNTVDTYGNGIAIGGGGQTIIGGGESTSTLIGQTSTNGSEIMWIGNDGDIELFPGQGNGFNNAYKTTINSSGITVGVEGNTTKETVFKVSSGAGSIGLYSSSSTTGNRGLWAYPHGTATSGKNIITLDTDNNINYASGTAGTLYIASGSGVVNSSGAPSFYFLRGDDLAVSNRMGAIFCNYDTTNNITRCDRIYLRQFSYNSSTGAAINNWDQYRLPAVTSNLTSNYTYDILTTKDMSFSITGNAATATLATKATGDSDGNTINTTYAKLSGAAFTGNITITKAGDTYIYSKNSSTGNTVYLDSGSGSSHGIWSGGYYNGSSYTSSGKWLIYRNDEGNVIVNGDCTGNAATATKDSAGNVISSTYLKLSGGTMSGHIYLGGSNASSSTGNTTQIVFGTSSNQHIVISSNSKALVLNPTTSSTTNQIIFYLEQASIIPKGITIKNSNGTSITINGGYGTLAGATRSYVNINNWLNASGVTGAVWNDYAEFRKTNKEAKAGQAVIDNDDGSLSITNKRLMPGAQIVSDTFGFSIGETEEAKTPLAVSGRVLVYTYRPREEYHAGMAVCSAPNGTIDIMTREEIQQYPDAIIGIVSEIPEYEEWGTGKVKVNKRIWIKIK